MRARRLTCASLLALGLLFAGTQAQAASSLPQQDPLGTLSDVTKHWGYFQPATTFCIRPDAAEYAQGGVGATATGRDPVCRRSGFRRRATGLVKIHVRAPLLCAGCRRLFIDFSKIPPQNSPPVGYAHGHAYYHLQSANFTYTVDPVAHSTNTKNFTNDKLVAPDGSPQAQLISAFDLHAIAYVTDTTHFIHTKAQGPYYIGPSYENRGYRRIRGVYLDLDVRDATPFSPNALNAVYYDAGFNSGQLCPSDADAYYGGCIDATGASAESVNPFG